MGAASCPGSIHATLECAARPECKSLASGLMLSSPWHYARALAVQSLNIKGDEQFDIEGLEKIEPQKDVTLIIHRKDGSSQAVKLLCRIDTSIEVDYYNHGGILPYVLRKLMTQ